MTETGGSTLVWKSDPLFWMERTTAWCAAHDLSLHESTGQVELRLTKYYQAHPSQRSVNVLEAWQRTQPKGFQPKLSPGTEPHWDLNGEWWRASYRRGQEGFLEGYLLCMRTRVQPQQQRYSRPAYYYVDKINKYLKAHPEADEKSIASILSLYQDKRVKTSN